ncbi:MAG: SDR family oxidoreductase [Acidobacteria bacterium]|nr:SDR family oxidoreductase [Acidobacteriota bacterium]
MRIVVTGAMGHIGSHVVRDLPRRFPGAEIVMIDNLLTQRFPSLFDLPATGRYRFIEDDVRTADLRPLVRGAQAVVHLAAITDAAGSFDRAEAVEANNYVGTLNVATACADTGTRLIIVSSTSVYGTQSHRVSEDCPLEELRPQSPYARTKLREESLTTQMAAERGLRAVVFRFGTVCGVSPGMRFHTAVNKFCWQAVLGQPLTVWSTAYDQTRPYLDLCDAAGAIAFAIERDLFDGRLFNAATDNATVRRIVDLIREFVPDLAVEFVDSPIMNQLSYDVSCDRLTRLGFAFAGDLRRAVADTIGRIGHANGRRAVAVTLP